MAKIDQEALKKHHFWILLGVFALFILILVILVPVLIGSEISEKEAAYQTAVKNLDSSSNSPTTDGHLAQLDKQKEEVNNLRAIVWRQMFSRQAGVISFPEQLATRLKSAKFGSELDDRTRDLYRSDHVYAETYRQMPAIVKPTEFLGGWPNVLQPISWSSARLPTSEEVWLSLEDLCVRREILHILREANDTPARFSLDTTAKPEELPKSSLGSKFSKRFVNRFYQLDLAITEKERGKFFASGKIKNVSGRRQVIFQLNLDVWLNQQPLGDAPVQPVAVDFPLDMLAAGQEVVLPEVPIITNRPPEELLRVQLRHSLKTVPIKRIDAITLGFNAGHRLADRKPTVSKFSTLTTATGGGESEPGASSTGSGPPSAASMPGAMQGTMQRMAGMMGGQMGGAGAQQGEVTPNGVQKIRYIDVTDQVRRMPVAVVLIVDQSNLQDVLAAFSNSKRLRFHLTQYHWTRHYAQPTTVSAPGAGGGGALAGGPGRAGETRGGLGGFSAPGMTRGPAPGVLGTGGGRAGGGAPPDDGGDVAAGGPGVGFTGGMPLGGAAGRPAGSGGGVAYVEQPPLSLVELTIYGVANLYEEPTGDEPKPLQPQPEPTDVTPLGNDNSVTTGNGSNANTAVDGNQPKSVQPKSNAGTTPGEPASPNSSKPAPPANPDIPQGPTEPMKPGESTPANRSEPKAGSEGKLGEGAAKPAEPGPAAPDKPKDEPKGKEPPKP